MLKFGRLSPISYSTLTSLSQFDTKELEWSDDWESNGVDCSTPICWSCSSNGGTCATLNELGDNSKPPPTWKFCTAKK